MLRCLCSGLVTFLLGSVALLAAVQDTEALRLAEGHRLAAGREMRTWKFTAMPESVATWPTEVKGLFMELRCEDHEFSAATLILLRDDYRLRSYPAKLLTPADRALAEKLEQARRQALSPKLATEYPLVMKPYTPVTADVTSSPHFAFYTGHDQTGSGQKAFTPGFLDRQKDWFEKVWTHLDHLGAPMPMAHDPAPHKINIYITGTGLKQHSDGFAFGGADVIMHPNALGDGSSVVIHEFTHSVQFYSKGFRDSPLVGWFWECHANWSTQQFMPAYPPVLVHYTERAHYELNSSRHNYGSWPFLQVLAEDPRFGWSFPYDIWPACKRNSHDGALEDPFQTIMRLGVERKIWKDGVEGFGDTIGELAARMVGWDFQNQFFYLRDLRGHETHADYVTSLATVLEQGYDQRWYPLHSQAPKQYGVNIVRLEPEAGAAKVEVDFAGIADPTEFGDWRVTLVAVDAQGHCRYSPTVHGGKVALDLHPQEQVALAVAATPTKYIPQEFRPGFAVKRRFPYAVSLVGAVPAAPYRNLANPKVAGHRHANGGGWVAVSAQVDDTAYVGPDAMVLEAAHVKGYARIVGKAVVRQSAQVSDHAVISGYARVGEQAQVSGQAQVGGYAKLAGKAKLTGNARLMEYATVDGDGMVSGDVMIRGFGEVHLTPTVAVTGTAQFAEDLEVHFTGCKVATFDHGLFYGFMSADLLSKPKEVADDHGLYAYWKFEDTHAPVVRDLVGDADGMLSAGDSKALVQESAAGTHPKSWGTKASFSKEGKVACYKPLSLGCEVEGHVLATQNLGFEAWVNLSSLGANLTTRAAPGSLFSAHAPGADLDFSLNNNRLVLKHRSGSNPVVAVDAPIASLPGTWVRLGFTIKEGEVTLYFDGNKVAAQTVPLALTDYFSQGTSRNPAAGPRVLLLAGFPGKVAEVKITHTGLLPSKLTPTAKSPAVGN